MRYYGHARTKDGKGMLLCFWDFFLRLFSRQKKNGAPFFALLTFFSLS
jgi:hypothetical protein